MPVDTALIGALRVEYLEGRSLRTSEHSHHTLFQTSTVEALLGGNYEGDVAFADWIAPNEGERTPAARVS